MDETIIKSWKGVFASGLFTAGFIWVAVTLVAFLQPDIPPTSQYTLLVIMSAMASGATGITAPLKLIGRLYIALMVIPAAILCCFTPAITG